MSKVRNENYLTIMGWMINELNLKGNDLIVYAIIYGLSQTKGQKFTGSLQYLADWCGCTKQGVQKNLKNLLEKGYITKQEIEKNGVKFCEYAAVERSCIVCNSVVYPMQLSCYNNIEDNIDKNIDNTNVLSTAEPNDIKTDDSFLQYSTKSVSTEKKEKKPNLYSNCISAIEEFTEDTEVKEKLVEFLKVRLERKDKPFGINTFKGMLKKLRTLTESKAECLKIIQQSIDMQYPSFFELSKPKYKKNTGNPELIEQSERVGVSDTEYEEAMKFGQKF